MVIPSMRCVTFSKSLSSNVLLMGGHTMCSCNIFIAVSIPPTKVLLTNLFSIESWDNKLSSRHSCLMRWLKSSVHGTQGNIMCLILILFLKRNNCKRVLDLLKKHMMGGVLKVVNVVAANSCVSPYDVQFETMYKEQGNIIVKSSRGSLPSYIWPGWNQSWNRYHDDGLIDRDLYNRGENWIERNGDKYRYKPPHELPNPNEQIVDPKIFKTKDMLASILNKMEGLYKVIMGMKDDLSSLNKQWPFIPFP